MTEDEAKAKWCPFREPAENYEVMSSILRQITPREYGEGRMVYSGGAAWSESPARARCIASDCMMWNANGGKCGLTK